MTSSVPTDPRVLPAEFLERLDHIIPAAHREAVLRSFSVEKPITFRINTLKDPAAVRERLREAGVGFEEVPWCDHACVLSDREQAALLEPLTEAGDIYRQGLSSILAGLIMAPQPGDAVLDACAAPGSKTSHMAALMANRGRIVAVERVKTRLYKLQAVLTQQGVTNTASVLTDVRRYRDDGPFDKVLVDAPCSSEGRFQTFRPRSVNYWSLRKVREMQRKQRGILLSAARLVKPGGTLVYSTCTFAPEENERVVDWFRRKNNGDFVPEDVAGPWADRVAAYPALTSWGKNDFSPDVARCLRVLPTDDMDGFFVARWRREGGA